MSVSNVGEKVSNLGELELNKKGSYQVKTTSGKEVDADVVIKCTGTWANTADYKDSLGI